MCSRRNPGQKFRRPRRAVLAVLAFTVVAALPRASNAQAPAALEWKGQPTNQPQSFRAELKNAVLSTDERERISNVIRSSAAAAQDGPTVHVPNKSITALVLNVEFSSEDARRNFHLSSATVFAAEGPFAQIFLKPSDEAIEALVNVPGIRRIEPENPVRLPPPPVATPGVASRGIAEQIVTGGVLGLTGKGVIFTIVDTGLDFRNPDFIDSSGGGPPRSRLLYFWDTLSNAFEARGIGTRPPVSYPDGRPIGTLYTRAQLSADLALPIAQRKIPTPDENGHGTAAAGLAVGNGSNSPADDKHVGVAPLADIIAVRIGDADGAMPQGFLLNAIVEWVDKAAREAHEPVVISCSFGGHDSGHDGASIEDRHLSLRFSPETAGRAIVISAGNEREYAIHAKIKAAGKDSPGVLAWNAHEGATLRLFFRAGNPATFNASDFTYDPMKLFSSDPANPSAEPIPHPTVFHKVSSATFNSDTGEWAVSMVVGRGPGGVHLYSKSGQALEGDAYFLDMPPGGSFLPRLGTVSGFRDIAFHGEQITTPGSAVNAITVGSYDWNDQFDGKTKASCQNGPIDIGLLSCYSNPGYDRVDPNSTGAPVVKPEIVGPGQIFTSSYARATDGRPLNDLLPKDNKGEPYWEVDHSGRYVLFDGTSASAPYVAGIVALMMQKKPNISVGEIKNLLRRHASSDLGTTGLVPNPSWGYGKLDLKAVKATLSDVH
jgi:subtilisin family serine protease